MLGAWRKVLIIFFQAGVAPSLSWLTGLCHGGGRGQETGAEQKLGSVPPWPAFHSHTLATGPLMQMSARREGCWTGEGKTGAGGHSPGSAAAAARPGSAPALQVGKEGKNGVTLFHFGCSVPRTGSSLRSALSCLEHLAFACFIHRGISSPLSSTLYKDTGPKDPPLSGSGPQVSNPGSTPSLCRIGF